jgi:hypothetical protein
VEPAVRRDATAARGALRRLVLLAGVVPAARAAH